jgi:DNA-binding MarR family transcriptional regulator
MRCVFHAAIDAATSMPKLRKLLIEKSEWYEACLHRQAQAAGYGHLKPAMVQFIKHLGRKPMRIAMLAEHLDVSRPRISQLAAEGVGLGILALVEDENDKRVMLVGFSAQGWEMVRSATADMNRIDAELARRIGRANLDRLIELLEMDWGAAELRTSPTSAAKPKPSK